MTGIIIWAAVGAFAKTLLPLPPLDDKVREGWKWAWDHTVGKLWSKIP